MDIEQVFDFSKIAAILGNKSKTTLSNYDNLFNSSFIFQREAKHSSKLSAGPSRTKNLIKLQRQRLKVRMRVSE